MDKMPWTLSPFCSERPPVHELTLVAANGYEGAYYECRCGERLFEEAQARWHVDGSVSSDATRRFTQTYLVLADLAWRRAGRYFAAMRSFDPALPGSLDGARLEAIDPFGAHFAWAGGAQANLTYEWLVVEDFEAALAAWVEAAAALTERATRVGFELPMLPAIEAARAVLDRSSHLDPAQRGRRLEGALERYLARLRRTGTAASAGLGLALDSPEAALADIWHRSLYHGAPTGNHAAADLEAAGRHLHDLIPAGWKLARDEDAPGNQEVPGQAR
jgi:hypothetical protein